MLAGDMMDRMRGNRNAALAADYDRDVLATVPTASTSTASKDLNAWMTNVTTILADGKGGIDCDSSSEICTVTIEWNDNRTGTQTYLLSAQL